MGQGSRGVNGNVGKTEAPNHYYEKIKIGDNGRAMNGNAVNGKEIKESGLWDNQT